jgi:uncharacterized protein (TIGR03437 family)
MPLLYVSESQINAIIPGRAFYMAPINVFTASGTSADLLTQMAASTPAIFTAGQSGVGQGAILNQDGTANSTSNPAVRGSIISIFGTGGGQTTPPFADGQIVPSPASLAADMGAGIGGFPAPVNYAGTAPYLVNGVMQVNVQIPENAPTGGAVPLVLASYLYRSQSGVTVAIK